MVLDANVFNGIYQVDIGKNHSLCGCPKALFATVTPDLPVYHDTGGVIEHEWGNVVDHEWFAVWLSASLQAGLIAYVDAPKVAGLEKKLQTLGFPQTRDIVYVRTSCAVAQKQDGCTFFTEDMDFYDPKKKGCPAAVRQKILRNSLGPVPKLLEKNAVRVRCVP